jgi:hypothetical protein
LLISLSTLYAAGARRPQIFFFFKRAERKLLFGMLSADLERQTVDFENSLEQERANALASNQKMLQEMKDKEEALREEIAGLETKLKELSDFSDAKFQLEQDLKDLKVRSLRPRPPPLPSERSARRTAVRYVMSHPSLTRQAVRHVYGIWYSDRNRNQARRCPTRKASNFYLAIVFLVAAGSVVGRE